MKILDIYEAADFLKMHWQTLRQKTKNGVIPGAKIGKRWIFLEEDLVIFIQSQYAVTCSPRSQVQQRGKNSCFTNDRNQNFTGADLPHQVALKYEEALKPQIKRRQKNTKPD